MSNQDTRRYFVPEVVQTSAMDCGPATLKCLLEGFGIPISYGRLREACQTDVDGTSIDTMEEIAQQLGLDATQIMLPWDHLLLRESKALPAIAVTRQSNGLTHFVVVWRRHGPLVQLMDPACGRRWITVKRFLEEIYVHEYNLPIRDWRLWAESNQFLDGLRRRLTALGIRTSTTAALLETALKDPGWKSLGALDAVTRMIEAIVRSGGLPRGFQAEGVLQSFLQQAQTSAPGRDHPIPSSYWSVQPADDSETLTMRGAVLVRVSRKKQKTSALDEGTLERPIQASSGQGLSPELKAALHEPKTRPGMELLKLLRADGLLTPAALALASFLAAVGVVVEAVLFRGLIDLGRELGLAGQRLGAMTALIIFLISLLVLEFPLIGGLLRVGRRLELGWRLAFLEKIPKLIDRYFQSRPTSDMAERAHSTSDLRQLPALGGLFLRYSFELALTTAGIAWLVPASAPLALLAATMAIGLPFLAQPLLTERDLRIQTHVGAISRFYLDALLGLMAVRTHGAERAVRSEHESMVVEWIRASLRLQRGVVLFEGFQLFIGFGLAAWLLFSHLGHGGEPGGVLLIVYWALNLPVLGQQLALVARQYPTKRSITLRLLEPLGAPEESRIAAPKASDTAQEPSQTTCCVSITLEEVSVVAAGNTILDKIHLGIPAGSHVGIVGASGAGKSSLAGLLLGWHRPASGRVFVDGEALDATRLERLRCVTAWVDPSIQLWNRSLVDNLTYGNGLQAAPSVGSAIEKADLLKVLEKLPEGLQTLLGEGGGFLSGGEAQRVRLGRAMLKPGARLVILDEPFRGLDRDKRRQLLARARVLWKDQTLLCITHDVGDTKDFDRVLVMAGGRIMEDDSPAALANNPDSHFSALLRAEEEVRNGLWASDVWRRCRLENGTVLEGLRG